MFSPSYAAKNLYSKSFIRIIKIIVYRMSEFETLTLQCQDGYRLSARFYAAISEIAKLPVLVCPATGITKQFYHQFCVWLQAQGYAVMVFDLRGISDSPQRRLRDSKASIVQWVQLHIPAATDALLTRTNTEEMT